MLPGRGQTPAPPRFRRNSHALMIRQPPQRGQPVRSGHLSEHDAAQHGGAASASASASAVGRQLDQRSRVVYLYLSPSMPQTRSGPQPRGQPGNRGQWKTAPAADQPAPARGTMRLDDPAPDRPARRVRKPSMQVADAPGGGWHVSIRGNNSNRFYEGVEEIKTVPKARFGKSTQKWAVPESSRDRLAETLGRLRQDGWDITGTLAPAEPRDHHAPAGEDTTRRLREACPDIELRDYQIAGAAFALQNRRVLIADEPGLGKTYEALSAVAAAGAYPAVVVCPAALRIQWEREAAVINPDRKIANLAQKQADPADNADADIFIVGYETLAARKESLPENPAAVVMDEAHYVKSGKAQRTKAAAALCGKVPDDGMIIGLTGTPLLGSPADLVPFLDMTGRIDRFGSKSRFLNRYCLTRDIWAPQAKRTIRKYEGGMNLAELHRRLSDGIMIRRRKSEVLDDLPAKTTSLVPISLDPAMGLLYSECELSVAESLAETHLDSLVWMAESVSADEENPGDMWAEGTLWHRDEADRVMDELLEPVIMGRPLSDEITERIRTLQRATLSDSPAAQVTFLRRLAAVAKLPAVVYHIENWLESSEPDRKLVVFAHHRSVVEQLADRFDAGKVYGGQTVEQRQRDVDDFTESDHPRVMVCSVSAGGVGLNLQRSSDVVFAEHPWTAGAVIQAEDRVHRIGQNRGVIVQHIVASDTIDEAVMKTILTKKLVADAVVDGVTAGAAADGETEGNRIDREIADWLKERRQERQQRREQYL